MSRGGCCIQGAFRSVPPSGPGPDYPRSDADLHSRTSTSTSVDCGRRMSIVASSGGRSESSPWVFVVDTGVSWGQRVGHWRTRRFPQRPKHDRFVTTLLPSSRNYSTFIYVKRNRFLPPREGSESTGSARLRQVKRPAVDSLEPDNTNICRQAPMQFPRARWRDRAGRENDK